MVEEMKIELEEEVGGEGGGDGWIGVDAVGE